MFTPTIPQTQLVAEQIRKTWPGVVTKCNGRLEAAYLIASTPGMVEYQDIGLPYLVKSSRDIAKVYEVIKGSCTCLDHKKHSAEGVVCKHRFAAYIYETVYRTVPAEKPVRPTPQVGSVGKIRVMDPFYGSWVATVKIINIHESYVSKGATVYDVKSVMPRPQPFWNHFVMTDCLEDISSESFHLLSQKESINA